MSVAIKPVNSKAVEVTVLDTLTAEDYKRFRDLTEQRIERFGKVNLLVVAKEVSGWTPAALWEDLKFDVAHYNDVARLAVVGEDMSQSWMATVSKPFTSADVHYQEPLSAFSGTRDDRRKISRRRPQTSGHAGWQYLADQSRGAGSDISYTHYQSPSGGDRRTRYRAQCASSESGAFHRSRRPERLAAPHREF